jgi:hypothetical protein
MRTIEEPTFPELFEKHEGVLHRRLVAKLEQCIFRPEWATDSGGARALNTVCASGLSEGE